MAFTVISHWFHMRQGLAVGVVSVGSAVRGILFSLVLQALFSQWPWKSSMLFLSAILLCLLGLGNLLVKGPTRETNRGLNLDLSCLKSLTFWLLCYTVFGTAIPPRPRPKYVALTCRNANSHGARALHPVGGNSNIFRLYRFGKPVLSGDDVQRVGKS